MISPKVTIPAIAAAALTLLCWIASLAGVTVPAEAQGAATVILIAVLGYLVPDPARIVD